MTFLELVQQLGSETGTELQSKITSVAMPPAVAYGETTEHRSRLVRWTQRAWLDIQQDQEQWDFMVKRTIMHLAKNQWVYPIKDIVDANLPPAQQDYLYESLVPFVAPRDLRYIWIVGTVPDPNQRQICYYVPPEQFFGFLDRHNDRTTGIPGRYTFDRDGCIVFDSKPSDNHLHIEFEYRAMPHHLVNDGDVPRGLPSKFHDLITYRAMTHYSGFDETGVQMQRAAKLYRDLMNKLRIEYLREYSMAGTWT